MKNNGKIQDLNFALSGYIMAADENKEIEDLDSPFITEEYKRISKESIHWRNTFYRYKQLYNMTTNVFVIPGSLNIVSGDRSDCIYDFTGRILNFMEWVSSRVEDYFNEQYISIYCKNHRISLASFDEVIEEITYSYHQKNDYHVNWFTFPNKYNIALKEVIDCLCEKRKLNLYHTDHRSKLSEVDKILEKQMFMYMPYLWEDLNSGDERTEHSERLHSLVETAVKEKEKTIKKQQKMELKHKQVELENGQSIQYCTFGSKKNIPLYIINAYGVDTEAWIPFLSLLSNDYYVAIGEIRGVGHDKTIKNNEPNFGIYDHVDDIHQIIQKEKIDQFHFLAWCSGAKQSLIYSQKYPEKVLSTMIIAGEFSPYTGSKKDHTKFSESIKEVYNLINMDERMLEYYMKVIQGGIFTTTVNYEKLVSNVESSDTGDLASFISRIVPDKDKDTILGTYSTRERMLKFLRMCMEYYEHDMENIISSLSLPILYLSSERDVVANSNQAIWACSKTKHGFHINLIEASHWTILERYEDLLYHINAHIQNVYSGKCNEYYQK